MRRITTLNELQVQCNLQRSATSAFSLPISLSSLRKWRLSACGALEHESGRFFRVVGATTAPQLLTTGPHTHPMLDQPEIGMLCLFLTEIEAETHGLITFKFEPGTPKGIEVAPSFQATKSNYERAHGGKAVPGQDIAFSDRNTVLADALQREQEAWFLGKVNRNRVLMLPSDSAESVNKLIPNSYWVPLTILIKALLIDNLLNMDLRSILSTIVVNNTLGHFLHSRQIQSSAAYIRSYLGSPIPIRQCSLLELPGWKFESSLASPHIGSTSVVGRRISVTTREVAEWDQPLLTPGSKGKCILFARKDKTDQSWEIALTPRRRLGSTRGFTLEPTIQKHCCSHESRKQLSEESIDDLISQARHVVAAEHAEEGGRFYHAQTEYQIVFLEDIKPRSVFEHWQWMHLDVADALIAEGDCLSIEARTSIAMLASAAKSLDGEEE